uniref:chitinase n=1 Tax=Zea mays TaxID=4577 RepID=B6SZN3_MAIZE|nr:hypothetical protein [Zea mays]|eukprot:NP_001143278.1 uncharacterized protein LOC100275812 precursor [Zea mays]
MARFALVACAAAAAAALLLLGVAAADVASIITQDVYNQMLPNRDNTLCRQWLLHLRRLHPGRQLLPGVRHRVQHRRAQQARARRLLGPDLPRDYRWHDRCRRPVPVGLLLQGGDQQGHKSSLLWTRTNSIDRAGQLPASRGRDRRGPGERPGPGVLGRGGLLQTAIWFWMTAQSPKPSCHDVILGNWTPSSADAAAGRVPGYGAITNIINGAKDCGVGQNAANVDRIGYYKRYCDMLGVGYGDNLDCYSQQHF